jgi:HlyD family secretion protein
MNCSMNSRSEGRLKPGAVRANLRGLARLHGTLLLILCAGCSKAEKEKEPLVSVQVTPAQQSSISQVITAEAVVFPVQQAVITPKISSTIKSFQVQRGSRVRKGQLLAVLENADLSAAAEQSKGEFEQAEAGHATAIGASIPEQTQKAELDAAAAKSAFEAQQKVYDSRKDLFQQGALPRRDLDSAEVALAQAREQNEIAQRQLQDLRRLGNSQAIKAANGQLAAAKGRYQNAAAMLSYSEIRSPIDGVVTDRPLYPGELAAANQPLMTVMDTSKLIAKTHIAQGEAATLKNGSPAEITIPALEEPVKARVTLISPALDPGSTTVEVWVEAQKPDPAIRPGMSVHVSMIAKTVADAVVVPAAAVFRNSEGADYVMIAGSDDQAHVQIVQAGVRTPQLVQITNGVKAGDSIITAGGYALPDKTAIKIAKESGKEQPDDSAHPSAKKPDAKEPSSKTPAKDKE